MSILFVFCIFKGGKNDLQTEADRSAQRCIVASLHRQFPKIAIYGEEVNYCSYLSSQEMEVPWSSDRLSDYII